MAKDELPPGWEKTNISLSPTHRWKASPGHNILVLDRGAMRLEYPHGWCVLPKDDTLIIHDRKPPDDECRVQITLMRLPTIHGRNWNDLPLDELFRKATEDVRKHVERESEPVHDVTPIQRPDLQIVWAEHRWFDHEDGHRPILCRQCMARARNLQPFITFDYYQNKSEQFLAVWQHMMKSLRLGTPVSIHGDLLN